MIIIKLENEPVDSIKFILKKYLHYQKIDMYC